MLFIDSGDLAEIGEALKTGVIRGITTNPAILAAAGATTTRSQIEAIRRVFPRGHISVEVTAIDSYESALFDARNLFDNLPDVTVKVPLHSDWGLRLVRELSGAGVRVNATCLMTAEQCILAEAAGADYVSLFYNRMIDHGDKLRNNQWVARNDAQREVSKAKRLLKGSRLICGSIRRPEDVWECAAAGTDIVTVPYKHLAGTLEARRHVKTDEAIREFDEKWRSRG